MAPSRKITRERIVETGIRLASDRGVAALTFQAIADGLGVSKQAVIHWYPSKPALFRDIAARLLDAEADAVSGALAGAVSARDAIERFVRACVNHHLRDLDGFKLIYVVMQTAGPADIAAAKAGLGDIHAATSRLYDALERHIAADPAHRAHASARAAAVAVHMAAIGLVGMVAVTGAMDDPLLHAPETLIDALVLLVG